MPQDVPAPETVELATSTLLLWTLLPIGAVIAGLILHRILFTIGTRVTDRTPTKIDGALLRYSRRPALLLLPALALLFTIPLMQLPAQAGGIVRHGVTLILIGAAAWLLVSISSIIEDVLGAKYDVTVSDNLVARRVMTQVRVFRGSIGVLIWILAIASMLLTIPGVRELGAGLLASAGLAGIVVGFAARPVLSNLLAGLQIALTQPIRMDDVVIINGEFGRIEEIRTAYVVVRIWDLRRMIVPLTWFIENPFQNWTYTSAEIIGSAFFIVDYTIPVEEVRHELKRIVEASPLYNGKVCALHVTEVTEHGMQLRAIMSARDAGAAFDLRALVREKLMEFIRAKYPHTLRRVRADIQGFPEIGVPGAGPPDRQRSPGGGTPTRE